MCTCNKWMHKKTKDNTQNPSVCFLASLFCHITMWCLRGCMLKQCIRLFTTRAHTDNGFLTIFVGNPLEDQGGVLFRKQQHWSMTQCCNTMMILKVYSLFPLTFPKYLWVILFRITGVCWILGNKHTFIWFVRIMGTTTIGHNTTQMTWNMTIRTISACTYKLI